MDTDCRIVRRSQRVVLELKEQVDLFFHTLAHFIIRECKENIFSTDYFSLVSAIKHKRNQDSMELVRSLDGLYSIYRREQSLSRIQFIPFFVDSTEGLFQRIDPSNDAALFRLRSDCRIDTAGGDVRFFLQSLGKILLDEYLCFYRKNRGEILRSTIEEEARHKLSNLCIGRGSGLFAALDGRLNGRIRIYICPALTAHARMVERNGDIVIAIGELDDEKKAVPRFLNIIHEMAHLIVDGPASEAYLRMSGKPHPERSELIYLLKEISAICFSKALISKHNFDFSDELERLYDLEKLMRLFVKKGEKYGMAKNLKSCLSGYLESLLSHPLVHT